MRFKKKLLALVMAMVCALGVMCTQAFALEYEFESETPGQIFYVITSTDQNVIGDSDSLIIGMDGVVTNLPTGNYIISPLSILDVPIGQFPDAWGENTDMAIAMNTMIPNELGPTASNSNFYRATYTPVVFTAGLAPLYYYAPNGMVYQIYQVPGLNSAMSSTF